MKKNKLLRRISVGVTALALIATSAVSVAFAKYQTSVTGTDTVTVAKWSFDATKSGQNVTYAFDLVPAKYSNVALEKDGATTSKLAPGTQGSFAINAESLSEVSVTYTVNFEVKEKPENLTFYYDSACTSIIGGNKAATSYSYDFTAANNNAIDGKLAMTDGKTAAKESFTIYWKWDYAADQTGVVDNLESETVMSVELKIVGWQDTPAA